MSYLLYGSDFSREVIYLRPSTPEDLIQSMDRNHLQALYAMTKYDRNGWGSLLNECVKTGRLRPLDGPWYVRVPE